MLASIYEKLFTEDARPTDRKSFRTLDAKFPGKAQKKAEQILSLECESIPTIFARIGLHQRNPTRPLLQEINEVRHQQSKEKADIK